MIDALEWILQAVTFTVAMFLLGAGLIAFSYWLFTRGEDQDW